MSTLSCPQSITSCLYSCRSLLTGDLSPTLFPTSYSSHSRQRDLIESRIRLCPPSAQKHLTASHFILCKIQNPIQILTSMTLHKWVPLLPQSTHTHTHFLGSHRNSLTLLQLHGPPPSCHRQTEVVLLLFQCECHLFLPLV